MDRILLIDKPAGMTSFDVVRKCRKIFHEKKIGHTGTLDPEASGLMIVLMGKYTKLLPFCVKDHKHYLAEFVLGIRTETEDIWGAVIEEKPYGLHSDEELRSAELKFTGDILQIPPMYSALKVNGKKLYEYARQGIEIEREPRPVHISKIRVSHIEDNRYSLDAVVSSGTYIRTLITDFCKEIGESGSMSKLERRAIEHLDLSKALRLAELNGEEAGISQFEVIDPAWKIIRAKEPEMIRNGRAVRLDEESDKVIFADDQHLLAAYERRQDQLFHCVRGLF